MLFFCVVFVYWCYCNNFVQSEKKTWLCARSEDTQLFFSYQWSNNILCRSFLTHKRLLTIKYSWANLYFIFWKGDLQPMFWRNLDHFLAENPKTSETLKHRKNARFELGRLFSFVRCFLSANSIWILKNDYRIYYTSVHPFFSIANQI